MKYIKTYEKLGIEKTVIKISERIFDEFIKNFDKKKAFTNHISDNIIINVSDILPNFGRNIYLRINYNVAYSNAYITIGIVDRYDSDRIKSIEDIKNDIYHEVKHIIFKERSVKYKNKSKNFFNYQQSKIFFDIFNAFDDKEGNLYNKKVTLINFLKYNNFSETYKKFVAYLYLCDKDEFEARLHEYYPKTKKSEDFINNINTNEYVKIYKNMENFKLDIEELSDYERFNIKKVLKDNLSQKNIKRIENYIKEKGEKFIKKIYKLTYFTDENIDIE